MIKIINCILLLTLCTSLIGCKAITEKEHVEYNNQEQQNQVSTNIQLENQSQEQETTANSKIESEKIDLTNLSNNTNAWGFRRMKDGQTPEFSANYAKILDEYQGIYCGNTEDKVIYLTFDEGYENGYTGTILDILKEKECPATFFVTKPYVKQNIELVQRMIDEGHIVR